MRFSLAFPYQEQNLKDFLARFEKNPHLKVESLCKTRKERNVELLFLGRLDGKCQYRVALTCRHHSCEMMASYVLEGIIEAVLADTEDGKWLREHVEFFIVPMMDKDGVEDGDQGKNRKPYDHNRDYEGESIHASVKALRARLPKWSDGKLSFALDMHCPGNRGNGHETIYFVGGPNEPVWKEVGKFSKLLEAVQKGPLVEWHFRPADASPAHTTDANRRGCVFPGRDPTRPFRPLFSGLPSLPSGSGPPRRAWLAAR